MCSCVFITAKCVLSLLQEGTVHFIYGLLDQPLLALEQLNLSRMDMGLQRVLMLRPDTPPPELPPDVQTLDVSAPNITIPNQETTYWCFIQMLPENMSKNHIVMVKMRSVMFIYTQDGSFRRDSSAVITLLPPAELNKTDSQC